MKYKHYPFNIKWTSLSPIHVGNGETLSSTGEYLTTSSAIYFLNHERLMKRLKAEDLFESYLEKIVEQREQFDFYEILTTWKIDPIEFAERQIKLHQSGLNPASNNILHLHIKTEQQAYIPGSTFKGMLRHAFIMNKIIGDDRLKRELDKEIKDLLEEGASEFQIKRYWIQKEKSLLDEAIFKMIYCADSSNIADAALGIYQVRRDSLSGKITEGFDWLEECIAPDQSFSFKLSYHLPEQSYLEDFDKLNTKNPKTIFRMLNEWNRLVIKEEILMIEASKINESIKSNINNQLNALIEAIEDAKDEYAIARIGKGKSIFFQTLMPVLSKSTKISLINLLFKEASELFPASRVLTVKDNLLKGWIKLEYQKPEQNLHNNLIDKELKIGIELKAYWVKKKTVKLVLNGTHYPEVQLINKLKKVFEPEQEVRVEIHQVTKDQRLSQVKVKS